VFEASRPFAFFDYFRVPYVVRQFSEGAQWPASVQRLRAAGPQGQPGPWLCWLGTHPPQRAAGARVGQYQLHGFTFFAHVALDQAVPALLRGVGGAWRPAEPVLAAGGGRAGAVWRDTEGNVFLPFDPGEIMQNFWSERYRDVGRSAVSAIGHTAALRAYYAVRPALPRPVQLRLRRVFTRVQGRSSFPAWPAEDSLDDLYTWLFTLVAEVAGRPVPYLDPWPDGKSWALVLTHDVETDVGYGDMELLRGPERERGYTSSWNFVGQRYLVGDDVVRALHDEGCEVGVHGLRHDGRDLASRRLMERRLPAMREYAQRWGAVGFRSPATQRRWDLMPRLGFEYDTSYSDTDPYEPQPGGCCTYLPYFNQRMVELPITMPQDHTLLRILQHADADVWIRKAEHVRERRGMVLILTHPDYARDPRLSAGYRRLLDTFQADDSVWPALPKEVAAWWRQRAASTIRADHDGWTVDGPASARGHLRFASAQLAQPLGRALRHDVGGEHAHPQL
jgi:peptidoglycan/xylan/chitin deacetylase (PgdA/CDA1 family)